MPPTDKPVELSEVERLLTALGQNASGWAGPVRLLWRYAKALVAEVAALRTENERLHSDWSLYGPRTSDGLRYEPAVEIEALTAEIAAMHERLRTARAVSASRYVNCSRPRHLGLCITHDDCQARFRAEVDRLHEVMNRRPSLAAQPEAGETR